jgi:SAM-dependent methyltransferase
MSLDPAEYIGVDVEIGEGVDEICSAEDLTEHFGECRWDLILCTEVLEHVWDWLTVVSNLKRALATNGRLLLTTRSFGFHYHPYPCDFWRFELIDICEIFSDLKTISLQKDPESPGVLLYSSRSPVFSEKRLEKYFTSFGVHNMLAKRRVNCLSISIIDKFLAEIRCLELSHSALVERLRKANLYGSQC